MSGSPSRRSFTILVSAALSAALMTIAFAAPASAAKPKCNGKVATHVGTAKGEVIKGTRKNDVIVARGGNDIVRGGGGNDTICGGSGHDKLVGGGGHDLMLGQTGRDKLFGGLGRDRLLGGPGDDRFNGGTGNDACLQGSGTGLRVSCERPTVPRVLARAYSDLVRDRTYGAGDVLIAMLEDTNLDGIPSAGDTIRMGMYPTSATPTSLHHFLNWGIPSHTVTEVVTYYSQKGQVAGRVVVKTAPDAIFDWNVQWSSWHDQWSSQDYSERTGSLVTAFTDSLREGQLDLVLLEPASPSHPVKYTPPYVVDASDNLFVEIDILP